MKMSNARKKLSIALTLCILLLLPTSTVLAEPTIKGISGTLNHRETVTISGSGFGIKEQAAPLRYDDFESGTNGDVLTGWDVQSWSGDQDPIYSNSILRSNSTLSAKNSFIDGNTSSNFGIYKQFPLPKIYLDAWVYLKTDSPYSRNHKLFRIQSDSWEPNLFYNIYCADNDHISNLSQDGVNDGKYREWIEEYWTGDFANNWLHIQGYFEESSGGVDDGTVVLWINHDKVLDYVNAWRTRNYESTYWNVIWIGNYHAHDAGSGCSTFGDGYTYWENVYVDTTQARVEIGNSDTYDTSTHREIQIPSKWSDSSISVTLNQGSFNSLDSLYLYVIDENGSVNSHGYPLYIDSTSPSPPTNLRVQ
jgi:hypothetical protein